MQEIGPRFTLKLRWLKKGIPAVQDFGAAPPPLRLASDEPEMEGDKDKDKRVVPPVTDEYEWQWRVSILSNEYLLVADEELARLGDYTADFLSVICCIYVHERIMVVHLLRV